MTKDNKHHLKKGPHDEIEEEKERLFRPTKHPEHYQYDKPRVLDKEVSLHLSFNLRRVILASLFIIIIVGVFLLGRYGFPAVSGGFSVKNLSKTTGQVEAASDSAKTTASNNTTTTTANNTTTNTTTSTSSNNSTSTESEDEEEEEDQAIYEILDDYDKVEVTLTNAHEDWKGTWGKIESISVTIKNNENIGIKPYDIYFTVSGYPAEDYELITLPSTMKKVAPGESITKKIDLSNGGFSYAEPTVDPEEVRISISLRDNVGTLMDSDTKTFDLSG